MQPNSGLFADVNLTWAGETYTVPASKVMMLIEEIEEVITLDELVGRDGIKRVKLSRAYQAALAFAGAKGITLNEIYAGLFSKDDPAGTQNAIQGLISMMVPPVEVQDKMPAPKKKAATKKKSSSARKRTKQ